MPLTHNEGADLYWTTSGSGPPILLIMGLSFTHEMWARLLPALTGYRIILFDNRGIGRSSVPRGPYTIRRMARDARAVLHAAGHRSAVVIGASMGGMIAQELALTYPETVERLILACSSHSGFFGRVPDWRFLPWAPPWSRRSRAEVAYNWVRLLYSDSTPRERVDEDFRIVHATRRSPAGIRNQLAAIAMWSAYLRLPRLRVPTLVVHGAEDRLVRVENGRALARRIPGALFQAIPNAGHMITTDQPELCMELTSRFLHTRSA